MGEEEKDGRVKSTVPEREADDDARDRWDAFIEERKTLFETAKEASDQYSKAVLTLAGGSLALSITFIKEIAPAPGRKSLLLLAFAWGFFAASILVTTTSFLLSQFAYMHQIELSQVALLGGGEQANPRVNRYVPWMKGLDVTGLVLFAIGLALTLGFATINLQSHPARVVTPEKMETPANQKLSLTLISEETCKSF